MQQVEATTLRDTLISLNSVKALVPYATGQYKVFWKHVEQDIPLPYIVTACINGGFENTGHGVSTDSLWEVAGHTGDMQVAVNLLAAIYELHEMTPVVNTSGWRAYATLECRAPIFDRYQVQNIPTFKVGGLFRIRLARS